MSKYLILSLLSTEDSDEKMLIEVAAQGCDEKVQLGFLFGSSDSVGVISGEPAKLPHVYSGMHLIGLVTSFLFEKFGGDHEFLWEVFYDEQPQCSTLSKLMMPIEEPSFGSGV